MGNIKAIILASGSGLRFSDRQPKQFMKLAGLPVLVHTLKTFQTSAFIDSIIVVCHEDFVDEVWDLVNRYGLGKVVKVVAGGQTRQESSRIGIACCENTDGYVLIHDSVRPFLTHKVIDELVEAVRVHDAVDTVIPSADTLVEVDADGYIDNIPDRSRFRRGQTPQAFSLALISEAHRKAVEDGIVNATDDCALVLRLGHKVFTVSGDEQNIKITYPLDLHLADKLFQLKMQSPAVSSEELVALTDKVFVVIGGSSGIGLALCEQLSFCSTKVHPFSRSTELPVDICRPETIQHALDAVLVRYGRIDFVINCSGDLIRKNVEFTSWEEWQHIYDTNINGNFHLARMLVPLFRRQKGGSLMFVGSSSYTRGRGGYAAYSSSKAALVNFCQALSEEVEGENIRVNLVCPGRVRTPLRYRNFGKEAPESLLDPQDVARVILQALTTQTTGSIFEVA
jgi:2-C-methyl-D-erythritol 4-phosphate cytidylyltransferase